jgi:hypothetical protein
MWIAKVVALGTRPLTGCFRRQSVPKKVRLSLNKSSSPYCQMSHTADGQGKIMIAGSEQGPPECMSTVLTSHQSGRTSKRFVLLKAPFIYVNQPKASVYKENVT